VPLFGLIGSTIYIPDLSGEVIGYGIIIILIGLLSRYPAAYCSMMNTHLDVKERIFVSIA